MAAARLLLAAGALALLAWIFLAYLGPGLRQAIMYYGAGLC